VFSSSRRRPTDHTAGADAALQSLAWDRHCDHSTRSLDARRAWNSIAARVQAWVRDWHRSPPLRFDRGRATSHQRKKMFGPVAVPDHRADGHPPPAPGKATALVVTVLSGSVPTSAFRVSWRPPLSWPKRSWTSRVWLRVAQCRENCSRVRHSVSRGCFGRKLPRERAPTRKWRQSHRSALRLPVQ
jgi:hypothetical protein